MKSNRLLKAFTLLELTIATLITAVCMGIAFYVLNTFNRIGITQQQEKKETYLRQLFAQRMHKEALEAQRISLLENTLFLENGERQTRYTVVDTMVIRWQGEVATDTLKGQVTDIVVRYMDHMPEDLVAGFAFELHTAAGVYPFILRKSYSAEELLHLPLTSSQ